MPTVNDDDVPATRGDLRQLGTELRAELATREDLRQLGVELRAELVTKTDFARLETEVARLERTTRTEFARFEMSTKAEFARIETLILEQRAQFTLETTTHLNGLYERMNSEFRVFHDYAKSIGERTVSNEQQLVVLRDDLDMHRDILAFTNFVDEVTYLTYFTLRSK